MSKQLIIFSFFHKIFFKIVYIIIYIPKGHTLINPIFITNPFEFYEHFVKIIFHCSYCKLSSSVPKLLLIYKLGKVLFFGYINFLFIFYFFRLGNKTLTKRNHPLWTWRDLIDQVLSQWDFWIGNLISILFFSSFFFL